MPSLAARFHSLFAGLERAHGVYRVPPGAKADAHGKLHDKSWARTVAAPVTETLWEEHLSGSCGLGIVPIRDDSTCVFGAIDVDVYPLDLSKLCVTIARFSLPLIPCRTKSGGAHLYLFTSEAVPADLLRGRLMEWAVALGYPGVEVFPKQTRLASEEDFGNWINMPYQAGERTVRYALRPNGTAMEGMEEFLRSAIAGAVTEEQLRLFEAPKDDRFGDLLEGAPPCLQTLAARGFGDWQNNGMFNVAVFLRKRFGDEFPDHAADYNRMLGLNLSLKDLNGVVSSVAKKAYSYQCKQEPICGVCNRAVCLTRPYGVGGGDDDPGVTFGEIVKIETDPPLYFWDVDGARMKLSAEDIMDQRRFHKLAFEVLNKWPTMVKSSTWQGIVRERMERIQTITVPVDATKSGQFWAHVEDFCTSKVQGRSMDELLMGKPFTENGRTFFRSKDLIEHLGRHRFNGCSEKDVFNWLRERGVEHTFKNLKGKGVNMWSVKEFQLQSEEHKVPRSVPPGAM